MSTPDDGLPSGARPLPAEIALHLDGALFIDGEWRAAAEGGHRDLINPADGSVLRRIDEGSAADAVAAVAAARRAFDHGRWPATPAAERSALLFRVADLLDANRGRIALVETLDTGK